MPFKTDEQNCNKTQNKTTRKHQQRENEISWNEDTSDKENGTIDISQSMIISVTLWHKNNSLVW